MRFSEYQYKEKVTGYLTPKSNLGAWEHKVPSLRYRSQ